MDATPYSVVAIRFEAGPPATISATWRGVELTGSPDDVERFARRLLDAAQAGKIVANLAASRAGAPARFVSTEPAATFGVDPSVRDDDHCHGCDGVLFAEEGVFCWRCLQAADDQVEVAAVAAG